MDVHRQKEGGQELNVFTMDSFYVENQSHVSISVLSPPRDDHIDQVVLDGIDGKQLGRDRVVCHDTVEHEHEDVRIELRLVRSRFLQHGRHLRKEVPEIVHRLFVLQELAVFVVEVQAEREADEERVRFDEREPRIDECKESLFGRTGVALLEKLGHDAFELFVEDREQDILLGAEVVEDESLGDSRLAGNFLGGGGGVAPLREKFEGGHEYGLPGFSAHLFRNFL